MWRIRVWASLLLCASVVGFASGFAAHVHMTSYAFLLHALFCVGLSINARIAHHVYIWGALPALQLSFSVLMVVHVIALFDKTILQTYLGQNRQWYDYAGWILLFHMVTHVVPFVSSLIIAVDARPMFDAVNTARKLYGTFVAVLLVIIDCVVFCIPLGLFAAFSDLAAQYGYVISLPYMMVVILGSGASMIFYLMSRVIRE